MIRASVPCNGCRACCLHDAIFLHPECGDVVETYDHETCVHPFTGKQAFKLKTKPDGSCIYLGADGCTIHTRAPVICQEFDCRRMFLKWTRAQRRQLVRSGAFSKEVFDAGRERLGSLL